jgi:glycosyltransferase involved in cell wall biosynthesis
LNVVHAFKVYMPDVRGGIPTAIRQIVVGTADHCRSRILATRELGQPRIVMEDGAPVQRTLSLGTLLSLPLAPAYPLRLWQLAREADLVVSHAPFPLVDVAVSLWFPRRCGLIVHWHSEVHAAIASQQRVLPLLRGFIMQTLHRADRIIVPSELMIEQSDFINRFASKCEVAPYGIDLAFWAELSPSERERVSEIRARYPRLVVAAGRLVRLKGFEELVESFTQVNGQLIILGAGYLEGQLRALIAAKKLGDRVILTGKPYTHGEFKCFLHAGRAFAMPSIVETFGLVQLEAMACGRAVINTKLSTVAPRVARHEQEALTITPGSVDELAEALTGLLNDEARARELGRNGQRRAAEMFGEPAYFERTVGIYREVVAARRGSSAH